jgi:hypothetical protein
MHVLCFDQGRFNIYPKDSLAFRALPRIVPAAFKLESPRDDDPPQMSAEFKTPAGPALAQQGPSDDLVHRLDSPMRPLHEHGGGDIAGVGSYSSK